VAQFALSDVPPTASAQEVLKGLQVTLGALAVQMPVHVEVPFETGESAQPFESDVAAFVRAHFEMEKASTLVRTQPEWLEPVTQIINNAICNNATFNLFLISFLFKIDPRPDYLRLVIHLASNGHLSLGECHQVYWQIRQTLFSSGESLDAESFELIYRFYLTLSDIWKDQLGHLAGGWIPPRNRCQDNVVILTNQLLSELHAPSADAYQNAQVLKSLGKHITLINTADIPSKMSVPLFNPALSNYSKEALNATQIRYKENIFPLHQCSQEMPNVAALEKVVEIVREVNPQFVLSLGGSSPAADLCALFTTVATIPFGGVFPIASSQALVVPRIIENDDRDLCSRLGFHNDALVTAQYAFAAQEPEPAHPRSILGIPEDAISMCLVGTRFERELTPAFLSILDEAITIDPRLFFVVVGPFDDSSSIMSNFPELKSRVGVLGFRDDVPKILSACDAYLNPPRSGGATSAVAAMAAGIPVLSQPWGDVADQACREGFYESWSTASDIAAFAKRLTVEHDLRDSLATRLKERARVCMDRSAMLLHLATHLEDHVLDRRPVFREQAQ
jgi:glycosyltransferase involved in cell wall biosynthesis